MIRLIRVKLLSFVLLSMTVLSSCTGHEADFVRSLNAPSFADWVLINGKIVTVDRNASIKEALAIKGGLIVAIGSDGEMRRWRGPHTREINLGGRTVIPGLVDAHTNVTAATIVGDSALPQDNAQSTATRLEQTRERLAKRFRELNRLGLTSIGDVHTVPIDFAYRRVLESMARSGELTVRIDFYVAANERGDAVEQFSRALEEIKGLEQNASFRFVGFAESARGADNDAAAQQRLRQAVEFFARGGYNFHLRARGEATARQLLDVIEAVNRKTPTARSRIGFVDLEDATPETIQRIKNLGAGIIVSSQLSPSDQSGPKSKTDYRSRAAPLRAMLAAGLQLGVGTDASGLKNDSPMLTLWRLITENNIGAASAGQPKQNISRLDALRAYTLGGAWFTADDNRKGSIEIGKLADLVVLNDDYLSVAEERIPTLQSLVTMIGGRIVYAAGPFAAMEQPEKRKHAQRTRGNCHGCSSHSLRLP
jgi:predicted amidohydrolase YtcJ